MIWMLAGLSFGVAVALGGGAVVEVGAPRTQRQRLAGRSAGTRAARRSSVSCCDAPSDDWRESRWFYDRWRPDRQVTYREALGEVWRESEELAKAGDYSKPASRRAVLGRMHQHKLAQWEECRARCFGVAGKLRIVPYGETIVVSWGDDSYYVSPGGPEGSWVLMADVNGTPVDWFDTAHEAIDAARERLHDEHATGEQYGKGEVPF